MGKINYSREAITIRKYIYATGFNQRSADAFIIFANESDLFKRHTTSINLRGYFIHHKLVKSIGKFILYLSTANRMVCKFIGHHHIVLCTPL